MQATYYASIGSQRTGQRWAMNLSKELWKPIHGKWLHRNHALHETPAIDFLSGSGKLREAILREMHLSYAGTIYMGLEDCVSTKNITRV